MVIPHLTGLLPVIITLSYVQKEAELEMEESIQLPLKFQILTGTVL